MKIELCVSFMRREKLEEKMKQICKCVLVLFSILAFFGCVSSPSSRYRYSITLDSSIKNPFIQSAWVSYSTPIRDDMDKFYFQNPNGDYIVPYDIELNARNNMIDFYLRVKKDYAINDNYIEDLIKIRSSNMLKGYVFFSFNHGNWTNVENFQEEIFTEWMKNNLPEHIPLTLASIKKQD